jgi:hypothetical protein
VKNASGQTVGEVTVTALRDDGTIRAIISSSDGRYSFPDLQPGQWALTFQADGYGSATVSSLTVASAQATRYDPIITAQPQQLAATQQRSPAVVAGSTAAPVSGGASSASSLWGTVSRAAAYATLPAHASTVVTESPGGGAPVPTVPEALQAPPPPPDNDTYTPYANAGDFGWMNGTGRSMTPVFDTNFFTPEVRFDVNYLQSLNHPVDHTIVGSTEEFRSGEFQIEQVSFGGNFHWHGVQARFLSMFGEFAVTTPRNDASEGVGQWNLQAAYKYMSEANAGYHWDNVGHGLNVDVGIFVSYIGLFSYYNFDNWTYQPSFVSSNTPWFFNGLRIQYWPTQSLKIEPWLINGWQSYSKFNSHPGFGGQILWIPSNSFKMVFNTYTLGQDNLSTNGGTNALICNGGNPYAAGVQDGGAVCPGNPTPDDYVNWAKVQRIHEDDSLLWKYYDAGEGPTLGGISRMAMSLTVDIGCEYGGKVNGKGGVSCTGGPHQETFMGSMIYNRVWFDHNIFAVTLGGGFMSNPGRYLALLPPINGATAASGTPYFTENPGQKLFQWDAQLNLQYMPKQWITWWTEATYRRSNVPYWTGSGGVTPPGGYSSVPAGGTLGGLVCNDGTAANATACVNDGGMWTPDLRTSEIIWGAGVMVKF